MKNVGRKHSTSADTVFLSYGSQAHPAALQVTGTPSARPSRRPAPSSLTCGYSYCTEIFKCLKTE